MPVLDDHVRSIAVVRLRTGLGDLLCGVPALRALRARLPRARVTLVTFAEMAPVVARMGAYVDELLPFPGWPGIPERPVDEAARPGFLAAARERRFDVALQAYGANPAANAVTAALGARVTAGFFAPGAVEVDLATHLPYPGHRHEVDRHLDLLAHLGVPAAGRALELPLTAADRAEAAALGLRAPYALVHPGATSPSRRWPAERFAAVADGLADRGCAVAVTGVAAERPLTAAGVAALLEGAALQVCSDTGAAHVAAAVGTPSAVVFLSGDPVRWAHPGHRVARVPVECSPCRHLACPIDHRCATRLAPADVLAAVDALAAPAHALP